jgi:hypothetical protein
MGAYNDVEVTKVFTAELIAASGSALSGLVDMGDVSRNGNAGIQVELTGDGTATIEALVSNHLDDFIRPSTMPAIKTGFVKTSGPGLDGKDGFNVSLITYRYLKIRVTETSTSDSVTVTAYLATN